MIDVGENMELAKMQTIRAAVCRAFDEPLTIEDIVIAEPDGRAVEVTLEACAICHSDITYIVQNNKWYPAVLNRKVSFCLIILANKYQKKMGLTHHL